MIKLLSRPVISSCECAEFARRKWQAILKKESVYAIFLNDRLEIQYFAQLNVSNYRQTNFNAREALEIAFFTHCNNIIIVHNHTSGTAFPSETDKRVTIEMIPHFAAFDVHLVDHIIITVNDYYSFADHQIITAG